MVDGQVVDIGAERFFDFGGEQFEAHGGEEGAHARDDGAVAEFADEAEGHDEGVEDDELFDVGGVAEGDGGVTDAFAAAEDVVEPLEERGEEDIGFGGERAGPAVGLDFGVELVEDLVGQVGAGAATGATEVGGEGDGEAAEQGGVEVASGGGVGIVAVVVGETGGELAGEAAGEVDQLAPEPPAFPPAVVGGVGTEDEEQAEDDAEDGEEGGAEGDGDADEVGFHPDDEGGPETGADDVEHEGAEDGALGEIEQDAEPVFGVVADHDRGMAAGAGGDGGAERDGFPVCRVRGQRFSFRPVPRGADLPVGRLLANETRRAWEIPDPRRPEVSAPGVRLRTDGGRWGGMDSVGDSGQGVVVDGSVPNFDPAMNETPSRTRGHRLWVLVVIAVLVGGGMVAVTLQADLDRNIKAWVWSGLGLLGVVLTFLWFLLLSRFPWRVRLGGALLVVAIAWLGRQAVRVDGTVDGTGRPRLVWKWSPSPEDRLSDAARWEAKTNTNANAALNAKVEPGSVVEVAVPVGAKDTPQFMGPGRDGVLIGSNLARDWVGTPPKELWRQPIGAGWSAFAVVGGRAFTQEQRGEEEWVSCYELLTGRRLWAHTNQARFFQWQGGAGPRATPTVVEGRVYAYGGTGLLDCLEAGTGKRVWSRDVLRENGVPNLTWGVSASPLVFDNTVVVTGGDAETSTVLAYHRETGEPLWKAGTERASYASPILATLAGKRLVLSVNAVHLTGHDPSTGETLLEYRWAQDKPPKAAQPIVLEGDRIFLSAGYTMGCVMLRAKQGADGRIGVEEVWRNKVMKNQFNSTAVRGGFLFGLDDGLLACVDAATGARRWKDGRYGSGQSLVVDDLVLIQSERGGVVLAAADPAGFQEFGRLAALSSKTWNFPTLAGRYLLARNDEEAVCYELPVAVSGGR